jgi:hypothetical protein
MSVRRFVLLGIAAWLATSGAAAQSSGAAFGAPPPPLDEGLLDCSLYRYGDQFDGAVARIIERFAARAAASADLRDQARSGVRVEVTDWLRRERLIHRVLDCPQPVLRGFVAGTAVELEFIALQATVCQQLVDSPVLARLGASLRVRHGPTGEARCGLSPNPVPGLLTLGRLTQAGRSLPGVNIVTVTLGQAAAAPAAPVAPVALAQCRVDDPPPPGLTAAYRVHLNQLPAGVACPVRAHDPSGQALLACRSLYDSRVRCRGDTLAACRQGLDQVGAAAREWQTTFTALDTGARADLAWRLMTVAPVDALLQMPGVDLRPTDVAGVARDQLAALNGLLDDGAANVDAEHERSQADTERRIEAVLIDRWLPSIGQAAGSAGRPADLWQRLSAQQRADRVREGFQLISDGLGLAAARRLFIVPDCRNEGYRAELVGAYAPPGASGVFVGEYRQRDRRKADSVFICANSTQGFADLDLVLETMLEEAMHARQMELVMQADLLQRSADAATCRHARLMAASSLHSYETDCSTLTPAQRKSLYPGNLAWTWACEGFIEPHYYTNRPHEYHAKAFAARVSVPVLKQARR